MTTPLSPQQQRPVVLIVDDVETNRVAMAALLACDGVDVVTAGSGAEALEVLLVRDVAVALIDVHMPEMDGFELAELMRGTERTRVVPILFVTGSALDEQRLFRGYEAGAVDYLMKPVAPRILRNKVRVFLDLWAHRQRIAETLRLNEMFTAVLSHDLRNPLSVLASGAALLNEQPTADAAARVAPLLRQTTAQMTAMIDDLLDLTRARLANGIPVERRTVDLGRIAEAAVDQHRIARPDRRIVLARSGALIGRWDGARVGQAVTNLLVNAADHGTLDGTISVEVDGGAADEVSLEVRNPGTIDPEVLPRVFDPFFRSAAGRGRGLGLGLFIVREIARAHGGDVAVASERDRGTAVRLFLPRS